MITRTWKNHPIIPQSKNLNYNPFQWVNDFEKEVLENNRKFFPEFTTQMSKSIGLNPITTKKLSEI